jgi:hypothetical protein
MKLFELFGFNKAQAIDRIVGLLRADDPALVEDLLAVLQTKGIHADMSVPEMESVLDGMDENELRRLYSTMQSVMGMR